jgi:hypothetical protein
MTIDQVNGLLDRLSAVSKEYFPRLSRNVSDRV